MNFQISRNLMIENQLRPNKINDSHIISIFQEIEKETFLENDLQNLAYSDVDINLIDNRGYLKNLHIAQLIQYSNITKKDKVLHIGGLTGYVTLILSKLSEHVIVIEDDENLYQQLKENLSKFNLQNVELIKNDLKLGYKEYAPYDVIFIDCLLNNFSDEILEQLNLNNGRLVTIEKIDSDLGKGICITKDKNNYKKEKLFDSFSKFTLYQNKKNFIF